MVFSYCSLLDEAFPNMKSNACTSPSTGPHSTSSPTITQAEQDRFARFSNPVCRTDELTQAAKDRAAALVEAYVPTPATEGDLRCIEQRQLRHKAGSSSLSLGVPPSPCRHGFPQAFAFDPCGHKVSGRKKAILFLCGNVYEVFCVAPGVC